MEINVNTSVLDIKNYMFSTFGIYLSDDQVFSIRKQKIITHLENWRSINPIESHQFRDLRWTSLDRAKDINIIHIIFEDIKIDIGRQNSDNFMVIDVGSVPARRFSFRISNGGIIDPILYDNNINHTIQTINRAVEFLDCSHLINHEFSFNTEVWS